MHSTKNILKALCIPVFVIFSTNVLLGQTYPIVGTDVSDFFNNSTTISEPSEGQAFYGQDANFTGNQPSYSDNGDGTVTDNVTGLMWQKSPDTNGNNNGTIEAADKLTWDEIQAKVIALNAANHAGYNDWRVPSIKELYSLTNWNGTDPSGVQNNSTSGLIPFIDNNYFPFAWGDTDNGERLIDVQYASSNLYGDNDCHGVQLLFGFNFADGRIKGYGLIIMNNDKTFSLICVRGNTSYGINAFVDNGDNTISDNATELMWGKDDSQSSMNWENALALAQTKNDANWNGHSDWRLPNAKEMQSILDYSRSPEADGSAAIDPIFNISSITNEAGDADWPWFWTSTTHQGTNGTVVNANNAVYLAFGTGSGWTQAGNPYYSYCDVHGAGCQRSDPKSGTWYGDQLGVDIDGSPVYGWGPQGDIVRVNNYVRLVRDISITTSIENNIKINYTLHPNPAKEIFTISSDVELEKITIFNTLGEVVQKQSVEGRQSMVNVSQLLNGLYFVNLYFKDGITTSTKVVISK